MGIGRGGVLFVAICLSIFGLAVWSPAERTAQAAGQRWRSGARADRQVPGYYRLLAWAEGESGCYYVYVSGICFRDPSNPQNDNTQVTLFFRVVAVTPDAPEKMRNQLRSTQKFSEGALLAQVDSHSGAASLPVAEVCSLKGAPVEAVIHDPANGMAILVRTAPIVDKDGLIDFLEVEMGVEEAMRGASQES